MIQPAGDKLAGVEKLRLIHAAARHRFWNTMRGKGNVCIGTPRSRDEVERSTDIVQVGLNKAGVIIEFSQHAGLWRIRPDFSLCARNILAVLPTTRIRAEG